MSRTVNVSSDISPNLAAELRRLVDQLDSRAELDQAAADKASGTASSWFQSIAGTDTAAAALRTIAAASRSLADAVAGKCERLSTDDEAREELREAVANRWTETLVDVDAVAGSLTIGGAAADVVRNTAADIGNALTVTAGGALFALVLAAGLFLLAKVKR